MLHSTKRQHSCRFLHSSGGKHFLTPELRLDPLLLKYLIGLVFIFMVAAPSAIQTKALAGPLRQSAQVEGVILDGSGAPVAGAQVSLVVGTTVIARKITDSDGRFAFNPVTAKEGTLVISAPGFTQVRRKWHAEEPGAVGLQVVLTPAPVTEEVIVTASRTETRLNDTPVSIVTISSEELASTAALRLDDALRQVPGFQLFRRSGSRTANPTSQGVSLRGIGASGASRALVLSDGIPLNDPFGGWVYWGRVPRATISRVEILRGGASHLYGGGAMGGVINILTRPSSSSALSLEISYGNQQTPDANVFGSFSRGKWGASVGAQISRTDGYVLVDKRERGPVDTPAGSRYSTLDLMVERRVTDKGRLFMRGAIFGESRTNGTPLQTNQTYIRQLSTGLDLQTKRLGSFNLRLYGGTEVFDQKFSAVAADRKSETLTRVQRVPSQFAGLTVQWSRAVGAGQTLVAGLDAREVRGASDELAFVQNQPSSFISAGGRERTVGLFIEDIFRVTPRLFLTAGVRLDRWREFAAFSGVRPISQAQPTTIQEFPDRSETAFSPRLSVLYTPSQSISFTASMTRAFRQPTLNELYRGFRVGDVVTLANENLRAERLTGGEAGSSVRLFDQRLIMRGTVFWMEMTRPISNVTSRVTPGLITRQRQNLGRARSRGLEIEADARLGKRWSITGGYLFADATVLDFPANAGLEGLLIPQVARHQLNFQARYANPQRLTLGLQGRASGDQFDDDQNRFRLGSYFTIDAFASRRLSRGLELFAAAENLLNRRYAVGRTPVTTTGPPALLRFGLRLHLGTY
jgi:outer membrane receptor protein involved in Fe transport